MSQLPPSPQYPPPGQPATPPPPGAPVPGGPGSPPQSNRVIVGVVAILLGSLGIHKFMLGMNTPGIILLLVTLVGGPLTCGIVAIATSIVGIIEGIIYLTKTDEQFYQEYVVGKKQWF
jgi:TM2 domain-containing membrane protein YozV